MIPVFHWNRSASKLLFSFCYCFVNVEMFLIQHHIRHHYTLLFILRAPNFEAISTKLQQQFTCRTIPVKYYDNNSILLLLLIDNNTAIILTTKRWNFSTCFSPLCEFRISDRDQILFPCHLHTALTKKNWKNSSQCY